MVAYWWVNHSQTYAAEVGGGYLWAPKIKKGGGSSHFYDNMLRVRPGDLIFSYADAAVRAFGAIEGSAVSRTRPDEFGKVGEQWDTEGWFVPVSFRVLDHPIRTINHAARLSSVMPAKYSPIQGNGSGNQGAYLSSVPDAMARVVFDLMGEAVPTELVEEAVEKEIHNRTDIPSTQKLALVSARVGQGLYRKNLVQFEDRCRLTGLADQRFLTASHIKPWSKSTDYEKLDGNNGLLLSPHVDRLFDRGHVSFEGDGSLLISSGLPASVLRAWGLERPFAIRPFNAKQSEYLTYHRQIHAGNGLEKRLA